MSHDAFDIAADETITCDGTWDLRDAEPEADRSLVSDAAKGSAVASIALGLMLGVVKAAPASEALDLLGRGLSIGLLGTVGLAMMFGVASLVRRHTS